MKSQFDLTDTAYIRKHPKLRGQQRSLIFEQFINGSKTTALASTYGVAVETIRWWIKLENNKRLRKIRYHGFDIKSLNEIKNFWKDKGDLTEILSKTDDYVYQEHKC